MPSRLTAVLVLAVALAFPRLAKADVGFSGYVPADNRSSDIGAMANAAVDLKNIFAYGGQIKLIRIKTSEVQTVSGKSFRFCLRVKSGKRRFDAKAVVYRNLTGRLMLTEWRPEGC